MSADGGRRLPKGLVVAGILDIDARETPREMARQTDRDQGRPTPAAVPITGRQALSEWDQLSDWERLLKALDLELDAKLAGGTSGGDDVPESPPPVTPRPVATGKQGHHG